MPRHPNHRPVGAHLQSPPAAGHPHHKVTNSGTGQLKRQPSPSPTRPRPPVPAPSTSPTNFDRRHSRRIATGRIEIEARLDLHGLTQAEAHARLASFLARAAAGGLKIVLIITGKGGSWRRDDTGLRRRNEGTETGILRQNVPRWLAEPALKAIVSNFGPAARHHGGDGAFYVQLRRRRQ
ncbi:MAG: Smr/MutS family protein [Hyphomicrobiaceae bacterium]